MIMLYFYPYLCEKTKTLTFFPLIPSLQSKPEKAYKNLYSWHRPQTRFWPLSNSFILLLIFRILILMILTFIFVQKPEKGESDSTILLTPSPREGTEGRTKEFKRQKSSTDESTAAKKDKRHLTRKEHKQPSKRSSPVPFSASIVITRFIYATARWTLFFSFVTLIWSRSPLLFVT